MVDDADEDGSGSINFPEFIGLMMKKQSGGQTKDEIKQVSDKKLKTQTRDHRICFPILLPRRVLGLPCV